MAAANEASSCCGCHNQCRAFESLPIEQGLMIMLHVPPDGAGTCGVPENSASGPSQSSSGSKSLLSGECSLKLYPQTDANLPEFHPNIYIPSPLLDHPDHLIKYGGGGE